MTVLPLSCRQICSILNTAYAVNKLCMTESSREGKVGGEEGDEETDGKRVQTRVCFSEEKTQDLYMCSMLFWRGGECGALCILLWKVACMVR